MSFTITMSQKELHRLEVIQKINDRRLSVVQAAELLEHFRFNRGHILLLRSSLHIRAARTV